MAKVKSKINEKLSESEESLIKLSLGTTKAKTAAEKELKEEIDQIKKSGRGIHIPFD